MKIEKFLPHLVTVALLVMSAIFRSPAHAFASVVSVLGILVHSVVIERMAAVVPKTAELDFATKKLLNDLHTRVTTLEFGVKTRGF